MTAHYRPDNFGNLVMRRAFVERDRIWLKHAEEVADTLHLKDVQQAYKICAPISRHGSGRPSPFYEANELIRLRHELDLKEGRPVPFARELAYSTVKFYLSLRGETRTDADNILGLKLLFQHFAAANLIASATPLAQLAPEKVNEFAEHMESVRAAAAHLVATARALVRRMEADFTGEPVVGNGDTVRLREEG